MTNNQPKLVLGVSAHIKSEDTIRKMMLDVIIALSLPLLFSIWLYQWKAVNLVSVCIFFCCLTEYLTNKITRKKDTIGNLSVIVTGLLFAFCLPVSLPLWLAALGAIFAILVGKEIFGGLGYNPFNPALVGRAFLQISWPRELSNWLKPYEGITTATPLSITKLNLPGEIPSYYDLFFGVIPGSLGETSKILLLLGGLYLLFRNRIKFHTPISYILAAVLVAVIFKQDALFHLLSGGLILGAFFMATDPVTTPITNRGKVIFGLGCGFLTMLIRIKGGFPEGVCYSILIMNMLTPIIDKLTKIKH